MLCASCEEFNVSSGALISPGPLLPLDTSNDSNASGNAIMASVDTANDMMSGAGSIQTIGDGAPIGLQLNQTKNEITIEVRSDDYNITRDAEGFDSIDMNNFSIKYIPGEPMLPSSTSNVLLPPNVDITTIKLEVLSESTRQLDGTYEIKPAPEFRFLADNETYDFAASGKPVEFMKGTVYSNDSAYPEKNILLLPYSQMRKWIFVPVEFVPFKYNPVQKTLILIENATVRISYELQPAINAEESNLLKDTVMDSLAPDMFVNYGQLKDMYSAQIAANSETNAIGRYVIITTNAIRSASSKLNAFIAHKQSLGYTVSVVTESDYGGLYGQSPNQKAEKIRQWLKDNYIALGIKYVLLIGDPTPYSEFGEGDVPMKMCWPRYGAVDGYTNAPTDAFYADLTGNWDPDGDGNYGEWSDYSTPGGVDFSPEVYVGRIPVYSANYAVLDSILQKTIDYETSGSTSWRKSALLPMSFSDSSTDGAYMGEQMKNDYLSANSYSSWRMYQHGASGSCTLNSAFASEESLRGGSIMPDRWAANDFGIVAWWGHGNSQGAYVGYDACNDGAFMSSGSAPGLDNAHPSLTYQCSCLNGYPESASNLQYAILKNGGIATVSATRVSWYSPGQTNFASSTTNAGMGYEYVKRLVSEKPAGDSLLQMKSSMYPYAGSLLMNYYVFNVYGDPSVSLKNPLLPTWTCLGGSLTLSHCTMMDNQGRRHVFVIGADNALWDNVDGSWVYLGGILASAPYAAKDKNGRIHVVVRGADNALWDCVFDTSSWTSSWKGLGGSINSQATAAMEPTYGAVMDIVVRGSDNALWLCEFNVNDLTTYSWHPLGGSLASRPFVIFDSNSRMHIFVTGTDNSLWDNRGILTSGTYVHSWYGLGGIILGAPYSALKPGSNDNLIAAVRGADNALWMADVNGLSNPETCTLTGLGGVIASDPFISADTSGKVHSFVRGGDGAMWENVFSGNPWNPSGAQWVGYGGSIIGSPQVLLDGATYAYVQGSDIALWRKVFSTSAPSSSMVEASGNASASVGEDMHVEEVAAGVLNG
jgi:hypothetical protein